MLLGLHIPVHCLTSMRPFLSRSQKRQILVTIIEICLPLLFAAILIALRQRVHSINHPNATTYPSLRLDDMPPFFKRWHRESWELAYVPSNSTAVKSIAEAVEKALPIDIKGQEWAERSSARVSLGAQVAAGRCVNFC